MKSQILAIRLKLCGLLALIGFLLINVGSFRSIRSDSTAEMISLEQELYAWAYTKFSEGKLSEGDLSEIFDEQQLVGFATDPAGRSFRGILSSAFIRIDSYLNKVGFVIVGLAVIGGIVILLRYKPQENPKAEQADAGDSLPGGSSRTD